MLSEQTNKEDITNHNVNRILLFKPQGNNTYIRKLSMSYGYYTALAIVNSQDVVTSVGVDNRFEIMSFKDLGYEYRRLLGNKRCSQLEDDDMMSIYQVISPLELHNRCRLLKPCRSMRYTLPEETYKIKQLVLKTLADNHNISLNEAKDLKEYKLLGDNPIPSNITGGGYSSFNELKNYNDNNAKGQTKLI